MSYTTTPSGWPLDDGRVIRLLTPAELEALPDYTEVISITGESVVKGRDYLDNDTRGGKTAFGVLVEGERVRPRVRDAHVWECKIGVKCRVDLPLGSDGPMRAAVERAFREITGMDAEFTFSGWDGDLSDVEREIVGLPPIPEPPTPSSESRP